MNHIVLFLTLLLARPISAADTEHTPLIQTDDHELEAVVLEESLILAQAHERKACASANGYLVCVNSNLISCDGLSALKNKLHLHAVTKCNFSGNKISHLHGKLFTEMPSLEHLNLSDNNIDIVCAPIPQHQKLKSLYLNNNNLTQFPFQEFLTNIPVKQLRLDGNQIKDYGQINSDQPSLEQLWLDPTVAYITKTQLAKHCNNLVAEVCEDDHSIQEKYTDVRCNPKFLKCSKVIFFSATWGCICTMIGGGIFVAACFGSMASPCAKTTDLLAGLFTPLTLGAVVGAVSPVICGYCCAEPDERYTETILKEIDQYPPMIQTLKQRAQEKASANQQTA
jgi:hypothetical protein